MVDASAPGGRVWALHLAVLLIVIVSETIGVLSLPIGIAKVILLPMLYAFAIGILLNPNIMHATAKVFTPKVQKVSGAMITVAIAPFVARFGTTVGPAIDQIVAVGPSLVLQEIGNLGTILLAFPVAVFLLRMGRETVGAVYSIDREPNLALIAEKYGLNSPEGAGVMGVYATGTLIGTFIFAIIPPIIHSFGIFDIRALAMACGVGSGSMLAACTGGLTTAIPEQKDLIMALAAASNILTYATGLYMSMFVALPLTEWMFRKCRPDLYRNA